MQLYMSIHEFSPRIVSDFPENSLSVTIRVYANGPEITVYFTDLDEWWNFRSGIALADDYRLAVDARDGLYGDEAAEWINAFYITRKS